ncbi:BTB/POZ domain-containing protein [Ditylenchus destructor]|uniref:BTB/POZ domain-containing protein n=1 Tax=Ditylenchus destructor TaxID=166010 RepID=A0AAD4MUE6_9BILA|nr:BTB/POZ domain-containing protein [Ditylenchus destructor]
MPYFKIDCSYIFDKDNGFINEDGECEIMAEISVTHVVTQAEVVEIDPFLKRLKDTFLSSKNISGIINLQAGYRVPVNKELLSSHSEYFNNIFNNEHFEESSQESIDLTDFTYKQFRLLHKHIDQRRHFYKDTAEFRKAVEFRLKSEGRVTEFKRLWNFADIKAYSHKQRANYRCIGFRTRSDYKLFNDTLDMVDDVTQIRALLGLFFCVSTKYKLIENQMVSAENIEDLLCVGSYFQISKILERCKEFLRRNYADFSRQRRKELVEKYNLSSVTVPAMDDQREAQSDLSSTELFVYVNFLDTDKEEMCSVKYEEEITIKMLYSFALTQIYSQGNCNHPSEYEFDRVRISDPNRRFTNDCQSEDIDDNDTIMYHFARAYRIYSFDVRKAAVSSTSTRFSAKMPPKIYYYRDKFIHEIPVHVNFLDTDDEEMCSIDYENGMTIQTLFFNALLHLFYKGNGRRPSNYEIETVGIAYPNILSQSVDVEDDAAITSRYVCKSCRYSFEARKISTEDLTYSPSKTIPFIYDSYTKKVKFDQENEEESEPKASTSGQTQNISVRFETAYQLQNIRRSVSFIL